MDYFAEIAGAPDAIEAVRRLAGHADAPKHLLAAPLDDLSSRIPAIWRGELTNWFYHKPPFAALVWEELRYCHVHRERVARAAVVEVALHPQVASWGADAPPQKLENLKVSAKVFSYLRPACVQGVASLNGHTIDPALNREESVRRLAAALKPTGLRLAVPLPAHRFLEDLEKVTELTYQAPAFIARLLQEFKTCKSASDEARLLRDADSPEKKTKLLIEDRRLLLKLAAEMAVPVPFSIVHEQELNQIRDTRRDTGRTKAYEDQPKPPDPGPKCGCPETATAGEIPDASPIRRALSQNLVGLAFSGGGIRSATFNLGILQALAKLDVLRHCDYLSTVSGGGYIGSWFSAWMHREGERIQSSLEPPATAAAETLAEMRRHLAPNRSPNPLDPGVRPIRYLREFSNYLTPQTGFFSGDTWTMAAIYIRNLILNLLVLIPLLAAALLVPRILFALTTVLLYEKQSPFWVPAVTMLALALSTFVLIRNLRRATPPRGVSDRNHRMRRQVEREETAPWFSRQGWIQLAVVAPLLIISWLTATCYWLAVQGRRFHLPDGWALSYWCDGWTVAGFAAVLPHQAPEAGTWAAVLAAVLIAIVYLTVRNLGSRWLPLSQAVMALALAPSMSFYVTWLPVLTLKILTGILRAPDPEAAFRQEFWRGSAAVLGFAFSATFIGLAIARRKKLKSFSPPWVSASVLVSAASSTVVTVLFLLGQFLVLLSPKGALAALLRHLTPSDPIGATSLSAAVVLVVFLTIFATTRGFTACWPKRLRAVGSLGLALVCSGVASFGVFWALGRLFKTFTGTKGFWHAIAFGTPLTLGAFALVVVVQLGLLGINFPDEQREWWSRLRAWTLIYSAGWTVLFLLALYPPKLAIDLQSAANHWGGPGAIALWLISTVAGVKTGSIAAAADKKSRETATSHLGGAAASPPKPMSATALKAIATVAPYVFVIGLLAMISWVVDLGIDPGGSESLWDRLTHYPWATMTTHPNVGLVLLAALLVGISVLVSWRIGVNEFSMHHFYKNRLVRCYMGASRWKERKADWFTGFDSDDDIWLKAFDRSASQPPEYQYSGPYPIVNAALNLVAGEDLAWQERKASSFTFTPKYCGYDVDRAVLAAEKGKYWPDAYAPTSAYMFGGSGPMLGTAMAISGAAANPNMGKVTTAASAFLMTVFNVRLGWWLPNTRRKERWTDATPRLGVTYGALELFGLTDDKKQFVNVSDGGHFENLGVYELVRRGCRYIIICDGGQDGSLGMEDLGNVIRKCRTDFGVEIDICIDRIRERDKHGWSMAHCVVGNIRYPGVPRHCEHGHVLLDDKMPLGEEGLIIYLKPSISGDEPYDILEYYTRVPEFPHESTADQWFNESQFESYRRLGMHIAETTFQRYREHEDGPLYPPQIFEQLRRFWYPPSVKIAEYSTEHALEYSRIMELVRSDDGLSFLDPALFDRLGGLSGSRRNEFYVCNALIQLIENVYADLDLEQNYSHPHVGGWMKVFQHWAKQPPFQRTWAQSEITYAERFRSFYNDRLAKG